MSISALAALSGWFVGSFGPTRSHDLSIYRHSLLEPLLFPLRDSAVLTVSLLPSLADLVGVSTFHSMERRSGWVSSIRRGLGAIDWVQKETQPSSPVTAVSSIFSAAAVNDAYEDSLSFTRPIFALPACLLMDARLLELSQQLRTSPFGFARAGWRLELTLSRVHQNYSI